MWNEIGQQILLPLLILFELYFKGSHSSQDEQGTAALKTDEIDDRLAGAAVQVRVVQGQEPAHFLAIFQGQLIIYQGGLSSSFDGKKTHILCIVLRYMCVLL